MSLRFQGAAFFIREQLQRCSFHSGVSGQAHSHDVHTRAAQLANCR